MRLNRESDERDRLANTRTQDGMVSALSMMAQAFQRSLLPEGSEEKKIDDEFQMLRKRIEVAEMRKRAVALEKELDGRSEPVKVVEDREAEIVEKGGSKKGGRK